MNDDCFFHLVWQQDNIEHTIDGSLAQVINHPLVSIEKYSKGSFDALKITFHAPCSLVLKSCQLHAKISGANWRSMMVHGYQSWSTSSEYTSQDRLKPLFSPLKQFAKANGDYDFIDYSNKKGQFHSWGHTYLREENGDQGYFIGSLDESFAYTSFHYNFSDQSLKALKDVEGAKLDKGSYVLVHFVSTRGNIYSLGQNYFSYFQHKKPIPRKMSGWLSWYYHYQKIDEHKILKAVENLRKSSLPFDLCAIDDGYQKEIGDWLDIDEKKFPHGLKPIVEEMKKAQLIAGLWIAPLVCSHRSQIFKNHPDWLAKDANGKVIRAGHNPIWKSWIYVLDFYNPSVQDYLKRVFKNALNNWGFDLLKLDFLYAACFVPRIGKTRAQIMSDVMAFFEEQLADKIMLACGIPMSASFDNALICRVGSDITPTWESRLLAWTGVRERLSTYNSLKSTLGRWMMASKVFLSDPDIFILRKQRCSMNDEQKKTLLLSNYLLGGTLFTSDPLHAYGESEWNLLESCFPLIQVNIDKVIQFDDVYQVEFHRQKLYYRALINLAKKSDQKFDLKPFSSRVELLEDRGEFNRHFKLRSSNDHLVEGQNIVFCQDHEFEFRVTTKMPRQYPLKLTFQYIGEAEQVLINNQVYQVRTNWDTTVVIDFP